MSRMIELKQVNKVYGKEHQTQVLFDINLEVEKGTFSSIIGQSGSGKSTLLNLIGTLDVPTAGQILINGIPTTNMSSKALAKLRNETLGFIFQFHYLLNEFTALENVLIPYMMYHGKASSEITKRGKELLELVGISSVMHNLAGKMSGGQQQRAAIARALINNPPIILADEPTGNLDSDTSESIYQLFRDIHRIYGTTFLLVTHDQEIARRADRIIEIRDGKIIMDKEKS